MIRLELPINYWHVQYPGGNKYIPYETMVSSLSKLTGMQAYKYRAFDLLVTLDLDIYKAERRIIVPANIEFARLRILIIRNMRK